jgi:hypothetical protein
MNRHSLLSVMVCLITLCGCYQTPQQKLLGRWYNGEMSLRFQPDGTAVYNSVQGKSFGRYVFEPPRLVTGSQAGQPNLVVDLATTDGKHRYQFEAVFIAQDRLRLHDLTPKVIDTPTAAVPQFVLLRRATDKRR